jgi:hypothetical protein
MKPTSTYMYLGMVGQFTAPFIAVGYMGEFVSSLNPTQKIITSIVVAITVVMMTICALLSSAKPL